MRYYFLKCSESELAKQREKVRLLYEFALKNEYGITDVPYVKDERGKPYIPGYNLHMSISHCKAGVSCIIADVPVGIDVEEISRFDIKIARKICTENELLLLNKADNKQDFLCRLWVLKEAYFKMTGTGFSKIDAAGENFYAIKKDGEPSLYIGITSGSAILTAPEEILF
jgi:phosphopantetheinyl transferase